MPIVRNAITFVLVVLMAAPSPAFARAQHVVDPAAIGAAVSAHAAARAADRAAVREALDQPQVRALAGRLGVDVDRALARVGTVADGELARAADAARQINEQLVGGQTVTITTTTIIIALLIIILIVVAAD